MGSAPQPLGAVATREPSAADLDETVGMVAHAFSTPLPVVWEMTVRELAGWGHLALKRYMAFGRK